MYLLFFCVLSQTTEQWTLKNSEFFISKELATMLNFLRDWQEITQNKEILNPF